MKHTNIFSLLLVLFLLMSPFGTATGEPQLQVVGHDPEDLEQIPEGWKRAQGATPSPKKPIVYAAEGFIADIRAGAWVFDGMLLETVVRQPEGTRILVTDYVFQVVEWLSGPLYLQEVTLSSAGGELPNGSGMIAGSSIRLEPNRRYIVVTKPDFQGLMLPFARVLQVFSGGLKVADEAGRVVTGLRGGRLEVERSATVQSLRYRPGPPASEQPSTPNTPPDGWVQQPDPESSPNPKEDSPLPADELLDLIAAALATERRSGNIDSIDTSGFEEPAAIGKYYWCGWILAENNYYAWLPDNDNWQWWNDSAGNWNTIVADNPSGPDWLVGYFTSGGNPIRDRAPVAGDGNNHTGVVSDAQLAVGGYGGTWAGWGANGINFTWYSGVNCTEIVEVDSFVNPAISNDPEQFRKSMTHELGHALGLSTDQGHENRMFALMYPGTWRQPPNYGSAWYGRMDDMAGERVFLNNANTHAANTWVLATWVDMATWSQTHDNWGSPGNLIMTDSSTYSGYRGDSVTIRNIQVENRGNLPASNLLMSFYFSWNPTVSDIDYLAGTAYWSTFPAEGRWSDGDWTISVPTGIPAGTYYIGWVLTINESERTTANNTAIMLRDAASNFSQRTFTVFGQPDLHISSVSTSTGSVQPGGAVTVNATVHNQGDASSLSTNLRYYYSTNSVISTADTQLTTDFVSSLSPGGSSPEAASVALSVAPGNYWIGVCVDAVTSEEFTNNQCSTAVPVEVSAVIFADGFESGNTTAWN